MNKRGTAYNSGYAVRSAYPKCSAIPRTSHTQQPLYEIALRPLNEYKVARINKIMRGSK